MKEIFNAESKKQHT